MSLLIVDINECKNENSVCPENSQCINTNGSYTCVCDEGYFHVQTESVNECKGKNHMLLFQLHKAYYFVCNKIYIAIPETLGCITTDSAQKNSACMQ